MKDSQLWTHFDPPRHSPAVVEMVGPADERPTARSPLILPDHSDSLQVVTSPVFGRRRNGFRERGSASGLRYSASDKAITGQVRYIGRAWFKGVSFAERFGETTVGVNCWENTILRNEATHVAI